MTTMTPHRSIPQPLTPLKAVLVADLERVLVELKNVHEQMLAVVREHRAAASRADLGAMSSAVARQGELARTIAEIDRRRASIATALLGGQGADSAKLTRVIAAAPPESRERLAGLSAVLRDVLLRLHHEQQALKLATEALALHMEGVMRQVYRSVSHTGTYIRSGRVDTAVQVVSALDVHT